MYFVKVSKNLARYRFENIFVIDHQNNYVEFKRLWQCCKKFWHSSNQFEWLLCNYLRSKQNYFSKITFLCTIAYW